MTRGRFRLPLRLRLACEEREIKDQSLIENILKNQCFRPCSIQQMLCISNIIIVLELVLIGFNIRQVHKEYGNTTYKNQMIWMEPENVSKYAINSMTRRSK